MTSLQIIQGDALTELRKLPSESVHCCVTSPPYWGLRDYGVAGQLGLERTPEEFVSKMVEVFREVRRVLREDGTLWLNIGDSYSSQAGQRKSTDARGPKQCTNRGSSDLGSREVPGLKPKDLVGIPWRLAFALQSDGWWLRQDIIWSKKNPMPESVQDRCTKAHEYLFLLAKSDRYFYDAEAIKTPPSEVYANDSRWETGGTQTNYKDGYAEAMAQNPKMPHRVFNGDRPSGINRRSVWTIPSNPFSEAHFATFPPDLIKPCILAGTSARGCCPKCGALWERVIEKPRPPLDVFTKTNNPLDEYVASGSRRDGVRYGHGQKLQNWLNEHPATTTDWIPTCECSPPVRPELNTCFPPVPCTVLDPFFGSGTTGMVSIELGRSCIGIELNPAYVKLAERRCHVTPGLQLA